MNKSTKITIKYVLGVILFAVIGYVLYRQISQQKDLAMRWHEIVHAWKSPGLFITLLLMIFNWGVEAFKWRYMMLPLQKMPFGKALNAVFAGCTVTILTPNRVGEYGGRILFVDKGQRIRAISVSILGGISQTLVTFLIGCVGLFYLRSIHKTFSEHELHDLLISQTLLITSLMGSAVLFLFFWFENTYWSVFQRFGFVKRWVSHLSIRNLYGHKTLLRILGLSIIRYLIFILQYLIMLKVMHVHITPINVLALTSVFFLCMALAPTLGFIDLPIRSGLGIGLFGLLSTNLIGIQGATLSIWFINIVLPAIIGLLIILFTKLKNR